MKKLLLVTLATALMLPTYAAAQVEVGTRAFGIDIMTNGGTLTGVSIPGGGIFLGPTAYLMAFPSPNIMVGPEVNFDVLSSGGITATTIGAADGLAICSPPRQTRPIWPATSHYNSSPSVGVQTLNLLPAGPLGIERWSFNMWRSVSRGGFGAGSI